MNPTAYPFRTKGFLSRSFTAGHTTGNGTEELRNSGERVFEIENPGTTITATVKKQESSAKQTLTAEIWKNGARLDSKTTSLPYGEVTVSSTI